MRVFIPSWLLALPIMVGANAAEGPLLGSQPPMERKANQGQDINGSSAIQSPNSRERCIGVEAYLLPTKVDFSSTISMPGVPDISSSDSSELESAFRIGVCGGMSRPIPRSELYLIVLGHFGYEQFSEKKDPDAVSSKNKYDGVYLKASAGPAMQVSELLGISLLFQGGSHFGANKMDVIYYPDIIQEAHTTGSYYGIEVSAVFSMTLHLDRLYISPFAGFIWKKSYENGKGNVLTDSGHVWTATGTRLNSVEYSGDFTQRGLIAGLMAGAMF